MCDSDAVMHDSAGAGSLSAASGYTVDSLIPPEILAPVSEPGWCAAPPGRCDPREPGTHCAAADAAREAAAARRPAWAGWTEAGAASADAGAGWDEDAAGQEGLWVEGPVASGTDGGGGWGEAEICGPGGGDSGQ